MRQILLLVVLGSSLCQAAWAADPAEPIVVEETPSGWEGHYAGALAGGSLVNHHLDAPPFGEADRDFWMPAAAAFAGHNWQSGQMVYGIEGRLGARFGTEEHQDIPGPGVIETQLGIFGTVLGRVAVDTGAVLPYVGVGVTASRLQTFWPGGDAQRDGAIWGGTIVVGADVKVTEQAFIRGEYGFSAFASKSFEYCGGPCVLDHGLDIHDVSFGFGLRY